MSRFESYLAHQLNINMKRLLAFGCSNTYGHGLKDCWSPDGRPGDEASKYAWPQILSQHLNRVCVNLSNPGASIREVVHKVQTTTFRKSDIVVVMFPPIPRSCIIKHDPMGSQNKVGKRYFEYHDNWHLEQIFINRTPKLTNLDKVWITHFADKTHILLDWITLSNYICLFLKEKKIKAYYFYTGTNSQPTKFIKDHKLHSMNSVPDSISGVVEISRSTNDYALDNNHPGEKSHETFANRAFQYINQNG